MEVISRRGCVVRLVKLQTSVGVSTRATLSLTRLIDLDLLEGQEQLFTWFKNCIVGWISKPRFENEHNNLTYLLHRGILKLLLLCFYYYYFYS